MIRVITSLFLAAFALALPRGLTAWAQASDADQVPAWLADLAGTSGASETELTFDRLVFDFDRAVEGVELTTTFEVHNPSGQPISIERVRACGCLHVDVPDGAIDANASATVHVTMDTSLRSGKQVKRIELMTDESDGSRATLLVTGFLERPLALPKRSILVKLKPAEPHEVRWPIEVDPRVSNLEFGSATGRVRAELVRPESGTLELVAQLEAPESGSADGTIRLTYQFEGEALVKEIPVRAIVPAPFRVIPERLSLRNGRAVLTVHTTWPDLHSITGFKGRGVQVTQKRRTERLLILDVVATAELAASDSPAVLLTTDADQPASIEVPVKRIEGNAP